MDVYGCLMDVLSIKCVDGAKKIYLQFVKQIAVE